MENAIMYCPPEWETLRPDDRAVFERVWRRVMPEGRADSPIAVGPQEERGQPPRGDVPEGGEAGHGERPGRGGWVELGGDLPCAVVCPVEGPLVSAQGQRGGCPHLGCDFPGGEDVPHLGRLSAPYAAQLQRQTLDALECWQIYRYLARRSGGGAGARLLSGLASEKHKAARRLAAAHFLISGVRYWPADQLSAPDVSSYLGTVRGGYQGEQQREQAYRLAAEDTSDGALAELYQELADQSREHGRTLRSILEQSRL